MDGWWVHRKEGVLIEKCVDFDLMTENKGTALIVMFFFCKKREDSGLWCHNICIQRKGDKLPETS